MTSLRRQFEVLVDPAGRLIHVRRRTLMMDSAVAVSVAVPSSSCVSVFVHSPVMSRLAACHHRLDMLMTVRAALELMKLVVQQVRHMPHKLTT